MEAQCRLNGASMAARWWLISGPLQGGRFDWERAGDKTGERRRLDLNKIRIRSERLSREEREANITSQGAWFYASRRLMWRRMNEQTWRSPAKDAPTRLTKL